jgi:hypothetical protein
LIRAVNGAPSGGRFEIGQEVVVANEFAAIDVAVVRQGYGLRVRLRDRETGAEVTLDPLDLQSLCRADEDEQRGWLRVGPYRAPAPDVADQPSPDQGT